MTAVVRSGMDRTDPRGRAHVADHPLFARWQARSSERAERQGGAAHRRAMLDGIAGRVIEVGAGSGVTFRHYPPAVAHVIAVEPEPRLRRLASDAATVAPVPVGVVGGTAEALPVADASVDAAVLAGVLCSVHEPGRALAELTRVLRPGGELRFYEHVVSVGPVPAAMQRALEATVWPRLFGGCHPARDSLATIERAGFRIVRLGTLSFRPTLGSIPVAPRIIGTARRP
jgi:ubiquinone/menaquinone biosynthesis C-methylase UbiE